MQSDYPRMLYLGGDTAAKSRAVPNAEAETEAAKDGFVRAGQGIPKVAEPTSEPHPVTLATAPKPRGRPKKAK